MGGHLSTEEEEAHIKEHTEKLKYAIAEDMNKKFKEYSGLFEEHSKNLRTDIGDNIERIKKLCKRQEKAASSGERAKSENFEKVLQEQFSVFQTDMETQLKTQINELQSTIKKTFTTEFKEQQEQRRIADETMASNFTHMEKQFTNSKNDIKDILKNQSGRQVGLYMMLTLKILIMITAIMLISSSVHISKVKPCELKTALDDISLEYSPHPCKYNSIKDTSNDTIIWGIVAVVGNFVLSFGPVCIYLIKSEENQLCFWIIYFAAIFVFSLLIFAGMMAMYTSVAEKEEEETTLDFLQLESKMLSWLIKHYKSDNTTNGEAVSIKWNIFFIKYDCCGVSEIIGTTNDFDNTPWCTTSGSCQATASQIPKTCCKSVSLSDYHNAPSTCHASVNDGTYKPSCISRMKALSRDNINEFQLGILSLSSLTLGILQVMECVLAVILGIECYRRMKVNSKTNNQGS